MVPTPIRASIDAVRDADFYEIMQNVGCYLTANTDLVSICDVFYGGGQFYETALPSAFDG